MGFYGNNWNVVNEGVLDFGLTSDGKKLKKELAESFKKFDVKGIGNLLKGSLSTKYNAEIMKQCVSELNKKVNIVYKSEIYMVMATSSNGATSTNYYEDFFGYYKSNFYKFKLLYSSNFCRISGMDEVNLSTSIITKDIIDDVLKDAGNKGYGISIKQNKIALENISSNEMIGSGKMLQILADNINSKYPNVKAKKGLTSVTLSKVK